MKHSSPTVRTTTKMSKLTPGEKPGQKGAPAASASDKLKPGKLFASFELQRELETGSSWLAQDYSVGREVDQVELKFLPDFIARDKTAVEKLKEGIKGFVTLKHPNILRIYDLAESKGMVAVEMEYVEGQSLSRLRLNQPNQVFEVRDLEKWLEVLCGALAYAHTELGLIHGDIKPANLVVDPAGNLKLKNFGIETCLADSAGHSITIHGSGDALSYRSPQRASGNEPSVADDLYSIGVTIFELLTGKLPFYAGDVGIQLDGRVLPSMTERRAELGIKGEGIPKRWEEAVAACLARDPVHRPQSAAELQKRLQNVPAPFEIPARSPGKPPKSTAERQSSIRIPALPKRWLAIVGIILAFGLAIAFFSLHLLTKPKVGKVASNSSLTKSEDALGKASSPTPLLRRSPALSDRKEEVPPSPTPSVDLKSSPLVQPSPAPLAESTPPPPPQDSPTPFVQASPQPSPKANATPAAEVSPTPSADLSSGVTPPQASGSGITSSATPSPATVSQNDADTTREDVVRRINAMPGVTAEKKASLVEKMNKARSMERLAVIPFESGQSTLRRAAVDEVVKTFDTPEMHNKLSDPTIVLVVAGYADAGGRPDLNLRISQARAESVSRILKEQVKLYNAMQTIGMGGTELLDSKRPDQNRAVEVWAVVPL
jgi:serine/threonine protein kinase